MLICIFIYICVYDILSKIGSIIVDISLYYESSVPTKEFSVRKTAMVEEVLSIFAKKTI